MRKSKSIYLNLFSRLIFTISIVFLSFQANASIVTKSTTVFKSKSMEQPRIIEVVYFRPDRAYPCRVYYTVNGITKSEGGANNNNIDPVCERIERNMVENMKYSYETIERSVSYSQPVPDYTVKISELHSLVKENAGKIYSVVLEELTKPDDADFYIAELKRKFPNVNLGVLKTNSKKYPYKVVLATSVDKKRADELLSIASLIKQAPAKIVKTNAADLIKQEAALISSDWKRYAVSSCFSEGNNTQKKLALCSGLKLDQYRLSLCLYQGVCKPKTIDLSKFNESFDDYSILSSAEPLIDPRIKKCVSTSKSTDETINCGLVNLLSNEERNIYECTKSKSNKTELAECLVGKVMSDDAKKIIECNEEHGSDHNEMFNCAMQNSSNNNVRIAATCLKDQYPEDCFASQMIGGDAGLAIKCMQENNDDDIATALCVAGNYLNEDQRKYISCAANSGGYTSFFACAAGGSLDLTAEQQITLECAAQSGGNPYAFAGCYGYRTVVRELSKCFTNGIGGDGCFGKNNTIVKFANNAYNDVTKGPGDGNEIVKLREGLLGHDNGEVSRMLRDPGKYSVKVIGNTLQGVGKAGEDALKGTFKFVNNVTNEVNKIFKKAEEVLNPFKWRL